LTALANRDLWFALADGNVMVVTRPRDDWSYADFRLFLGPMGAVAERRVGNVTGARDGGSTTITFDLDGTSAVARFFQSNSPMAGLHQALQH
jgi:hypothetical protein